MKDSIIKQVPNARIKELIITELPNSKEVLVYDLNLHKALCLNHTAALVWKHCNGKNTISDIVNALNAESNTQANEQVVWYALRQLGKHRLLEEDIKQPFARTRLSRREIIKKAGITAAVLLPTVMAIVAPTAVQAQSCSTLLQPCGPGRPPCCPGLVCVQVPVVGCNCNVVGIPC